MSAVKYKSQNTGYIRRRESIFHLCTKKLIQEQNTPYAAELNSLQHQINPHFIYNTLASIKYLSMAGQREKVIAGINSLTKLLRKTLGDSREIYKNTGQDKLGGAA